MTARGWVRRHPRAMAAAASMAVSVPLNLSGATRTRTGPNVQCAPMALERHWLTDQARRERDAMGRSVQYTEPEYWEKDSVLPGWLNRDLIAHLAGMDGAAAALVGGDPAIEIDAYRQGLDGTPFTVDGFNAVVVGRRRAESVRAVATEWGRGADLLLARCSELSDEDWNTRRVDWVGGELRVPYLLQSRLVEWWLHGEDLRAGADLAPRREHPPIFCTNDLAVRMIPYGLSLAGPLVPREDHPRRAGGRRRRQLALRPGAPRVAGPGSTGPTP